MKSKKNYNFTLIYICIAIFALLILLFFQISQSYEKQKAQFRIKEETLLEKVANLYESKKGAYYSYVRFYQNNKVSLPPSHITYKDTIIDGDKPYIRVKSVSIDTLTGISQKLVACIPDLRINRYPLNDIDLTSVNIQVKDPDFQYINQLRRKTSYLTSSNLDLFKKDTLFSTKKRIDIHLLNTIINKELIEAKMPLNHEYVIYGFLKTPIYFEQDQPENYRLDLDTSLLSNVKLISDYSNKNAVRLYINFPTKKSHFYKEMTGLLVITALLITLLIMSLRYFYLTIKKQDRIDRYKNEFISNLTHEFKTPISSIYLGTELLAEGLESMDASSQRGVINIIRNENKRLEKLVESAILNSQLSANNVELSYQKIDLKEIITKLIELFKNEVSENNGYIRLQAPELPVYVIADPIHTENLLYKLIDNAVKYYKDIPEIDLSLIHLNNEIIFEISDHGIGIPKEELNNIFKNLYRVSTGNIHNVKGFGLSLYYVKEIAKLSNWKIEINSVKNTGTTIRIIITDLL